MNTPNEINIAIPEYSSLNIVVLSKIITIINTSDTYNPLIYSINIYPPAL